MMDKVVLIENGLRQQVQNFQSEADSMVDELIADLTTKAQARHRQDEKKLAELMQIYKDGLAALKQIERPPDVDELRRVQMKEQQSLSKEIKDAIARCKM